MTSRVSFTRVWTIQQERTLTPDEKEEVREALKTPGRRDSLPHGAILVDTRDWPCPSCGHTEDRHKHGDPREKCGGTEQ